MAAWFSRPRTFPDALISSNITPHGKIIIKFLKVVKPHVANIRGSQLTKIRKDSNELICFATPIKLVFHLKKEVAKVRQVQRV